MRWKFTYEMHTLISVSTAAENGVMDTWKPMLHTVRSGQCFSGWASGLGHQPFPGILSGSDLQPCFYIVQFLSWVAILAFTQWLWWRHVNQISFPSWFWSVVFKLTHIFKFHVRVFCLLVCMCSMCVPDALGGQKRTSDLLELKLQRLWATMLVLGTEPESSVRTSALNSWALWSQ